MTNCKPVWQWTQAERLAWGKAEDAARQRDLAEVDSAESLKHAQERAARRRNAIGASVEDAALMVMDAQRAARMEQD